MSTSRLVAAEPGAGYGEPAPSGDMWPRAWWWAWSERMLFVMVRDRADQYRRAIGRDGVLVVEKTAADAAIRLVDRLVDDESELLTVLAGADAVTAETARLEEHVALAYPQLEIEVHEGGQPLYSYLVGGE